MKKGIKYIQHKNGVIQKVRVRRLTNKPGLGVARGPGSYFGWSEALAMARTGEFGKAAHMAEAHNRECPKDIPSFIIEAWKRQAHDFAPPKEVDA